MPATQFWDITPAGNGELYSSFAAGNPPPPTWSPDLTNQLGITSALAYDISALVTAGSTLSVNGGLSFAGWNFDGANLNYDGTTVNATPLLLSFHAVKLGVPSNSKTIAIQGSGSVGADSFAPTIPVGGASSLITDTTARITYYPACDPNPGSIVWNGMKRYNGAITPSGPTISPIAVAVGNNPIFASGDIGTPSTPSVITQTGADIAFATYGNNVFFTDDQYAFRGGQFTGRSWVASCKVDAFTGASQFSKVGPMARKARTTNSQYVATWANPSAPGLGFDQEARLVDGQNAVATPRIANATFPVWLFLVRNGDDYSSYYSLDGNRPILLGTQTVLMGDTVYVDFTACSSTNALTNVTAKQCNVQVNTPIVWDITGLAQNTAYAFKATGQDTGDLISAQGNAVNFTTAITGGTGGGGGGGGGSGGTTYNPDWPRLASNFAYGTFNDACAQITANMHVNSISLYPGAGPLMYGGSRHAYVDRVKALSSVACKVVQYYITDAINPAGSTFPAWLAHFKATPFWLAWTNAIRRSETSALNDHIYNTYFSTTWYQTNWGASAGHDSSGLTMEEYCAIAWFNQYVGDGTGVDQASGIDGCFHDNFKMIPPLAIDYNARGFVTQPSDVAFQLDMKAGLASGVNKVQALGKLFTANLAEFYANGQFGNLTGLPKLDGGDHEGMVGTAYGTMTWSGFPHTKDDYIFSMGACRAPKLVVVNHQGLTATGTDPYIGDAGRALRMGLSFTAMDNGYYAAQGASESTTGALWMDEYSADPVTGICKHFDGTAASVGSGMGWAGQMTDDVWPIVSQGVYIRRGLHAASGKISVFAHNPKNNGPKTINFQSLFGKNFRFLTGSQVPSKNNGASQASVAMADWDGLVGQLV